MKSLKGVDVRRLRLKPGDHIILSTPDRITPTEAMQIKEAAEDRWPGYPITVLNHMDIAVLPSPLPPTRKET
jgi:hypothetical protein